MVAGVLRILTEELQVPYQITNMTATSQENGILQEFMSSEFTDWPDASLAIPDTEKPDRHRPK